MRFSYFRRKINRKIHSNNLQLAAKYYINSYIHQHKWFPLIEEKAKEIMNYLKTYIQELGITILQRHMDGFTCANVEFNINNAENIYNINTNICLS